MLAAATPESAIVQSVCQEYEVTPEEAERDVAGFLDSLRAAGLICSSPLS